IAQAKTDLTKVRNDATEDITTTANNAKTSVQDTASTAVNSINSTADEATQHVDGKVAEFNQTVVDNGFLSPEMLGEKLEDLDWQKYQLTNDDGTSVTLTSPVDLGDTTYLSTLKPGLYYTAGPTNSPNEASGFITVMQRSTIKIIYFQPYNQDRLFVNRYYNEWSGWKELTNNQTDTGWIPYNTMNGVEKDTVYKNDIDKGFYCSYKIIKQADITTRKLRFNARNLTQGIVFAELPSEFAKNTQTFSPRAPRNKNSPIIEIKADGKLIFQYYH